MNFELQDLHPGEWGKDDTASHPTTKHWDKFVKRTVDSTLTPPTPLQRELFTQATRRKQSTALLIEEKAITPNI